MATYSTNQRHIYLVDDDEEDREMFSEALSQVNQSISLIEISSGYKLIETLKNPESPKPEIIFMDINMPKFNGLECLKKLKSTPSFKDLKVVILSTYADDSYIEEAFKYGASSFYVKPTRFENLRNIISASLTTTWRTTGIRGGRENFFVQYAR